jgi:hypothetical protein
MACDGGVTSNSALISLPAGVVMTVVVMTMVRLRKCGSRHHQDHDEKQSLFHVHDHKQQRGSAHGGARNFRVTRPP